MAEANEEESKCPLGFEGPNPHGNVRNKDETTKQSLSDTTSTTPTPHKKAGDRCPWPFIFFHDPATGMRDYQTWIVIGLILCWCWSKIQQK